MTKIALSQSMFKNAKNIFCALKRTSLKRLPMQCKPALILEYNSPHKIIWQSPSLSSLSPNQISLIYNVAILIHMYLEIYLGGGLAPSSQEVGFLIQNPLVGKASSTNNVYTWKHIFLLNSPCKFADSVTKLFGDYHQIVLCGNNILATSNTMKM